MTTTFRASGSICAALAATIIATTLAACQPSSQKPKSVVMSVALFGYQDRPIFDVYLNGVDIGVSAGQPFRGNAGVMTGVNVSIGNQKITWRDAGTGEIFKSKNQPIFSDPGAVYTYLGVHIYPDNTVELVPEKFWPEKTEKGLEVIRQWEKQNAK